MFCIALAFVFAGASLSSTVDRMQHAPGASAVHKHLLFSDISLEDLHDGDHHADHYQPDHDDGDSADHMAVGHHHHGDLGTGLIVPASMGTTVPNVPGDAHGHTTERAVTGFEIAGLERPPKTSTISA